jgi:hypothetical protein
MKVRLAYTGKATTTRVLWRCFGDEGFDDRRSQTLRLKPDGRFHTYQLQLKGSPGYDGLLTGMAIEPIAEPQPGGNLAVQSIKLLKGK